MVLLNKLGSPRSGNLNLELEKSGVPTLVSLSFPGAAAEEGVGDGNLPFQALQGSSAGLGRREGWDLSFSVVPTCAGIPNVFGMRLR